MCVNTAPAPDHHPLPESEQSALVSSFASGVGLDSGDAADASWGVAGIADAARGMNSLVAQLANAKAI